MIRFEELHQGSVIRGIIPEANVTVIDVKWFGTDVIELVYKENTGRFGAELLYRDRESSLTLVTEGRPWSFDGDGALLRLVSEAMRIKMAHLFDPLLAVHTSMVEPLPHQITAVYQEMLSRQPLRFLLADDPGAGKTIMAGLLIKELLIRGDLHRCMIVCPGSLAEQWQDEMDLRFHLPFEILTNDKFESARTGNWFLENPLVICRLDRLSRNTDEIHAKLEKSDWDLVVVDEAHKMSATFFGGEIKYTKRYKLGQLLGGISRHFLLMTATPHNGKEEDFQLFLALLDGDRFEGRFRDGVHVCDPSDLMRRLTKEHLLKFDGKLLFPERRAYTVNYCLSDSEAQLYKAVTNYVREEFNRANELIEGRKGTVGFALTTLQRRLASSPEAIYQSLRRRKERLEKRLREEKLLHRTGNAALEVVEGLPNLTPELLDELEDAPDEEIEVAENQVVDQASAAQTITELEIEIDILRGLEALADIVRKGKTDRKWEELSKLLQDNPVMFDAHGHRRKLVIFTEHRDTLEYLVDRIRTLFGKKASVVVIHGGMGREDRRKVQDEFTQDKDVQVLVATDAAGEGINLQRAHLMVNYDLPWNPNRLEQRFGRIHRIGQTEVCHLWNLVASETREGEVYHRLLEKLDEERKALGGQVFDVLGRIAFDDRSLRDLLIEAVRDGERPEVRARLHEVVDRAMNREHLKQLLEERALANDTMDARRVQSIREDMERAETRKLQPHYVASFFEEAFKFFGGIIQEREPYRFEITNVPSIIRNRDRQIGKGDPVRQKYERVTFEKSLVSLAGKPLAAFICPGHSLLDATIDLVLERHRDLLKRGAVLVDPIDFGTEIRALIYLEHSIQDGALDRVGNRRIVSRQMHFVEIDRQDRIKGSGYAPYLDYRPITIEERLVVDAPLREGWLNIDLENKAIRFAIEHLVPEHLNQVKNQKLNLVARTRTAVKERLTKEIDYWDHRAEILKAEELAGKTNARINSQKARERADKLQARLRKRIEELDQEERLSALAPIVLGGVLVVPIGLIHQLSGVSALEFESRNSQRIEKLAMQAVMEMERKSGYKPHDVSELKKGYDIESTIPNTGKLRFIEVKGRYAGAETITVTRNEILTGLNKPEDYFLAIVMVEGDRPQSPHYVPAPFRKEPDFGVTSVNYSLQDFLRGATESR